MMKELNLFGKNEKRKTWQTATGQISVMNGTKSEGGDRVGNEIQTKWKDIPGYENLYQASISGEIRSLPRKSTSGRVLKQYINKKNGYCYVSLSKENKATTTRVHVAVAMAWLGERSAGKQVNHIDGDKTNNAVSNLEYCTQSENMKHAFKLGLEKPAGLRVINLSTGVVYDSASDAARAISDGKARGEMVARVCRGKRSHYRTYRFAFYDDYIAGSIPEYCGKFRRKESESLWV